MNQLDGTKSAVLTLKLARITLFAQLLVITESVFKKIRNNAEEIVDYCNRYPVLNFAGAHETDGVVRFSEKIEGSCTIVTSIPMKELEETPPNGESGLKVLMRTKEIIAEIIEKHPGQTILIVTHGYCCISMNILLKGTYCEPQTAGYIIFD